MTDHWSNLDQHRISGITVHGGIDFDLPLVSHITGNLWTGGVRDGVRLPDEFVAVISLYPWERYKIGPDTVRHTFEMTDDDTIPGRGDLTRLVTRVNNLRSWGPTLVHCQAGLNRSGFIAAYALMVGDGMPATDAIDLLRRRRSPAVLCNQAFELWLLDQWGTP